ncbi:probable G-protein coupled receptor 101 [Branchiostoma floridae]|uniref:Probable G-protein coupled receptor 101 n=2 Tax=Branchiostoma floridae TaxID=7739 RepID=A0A9J7N7D2_BRAFL|nr:probable G-protein coupled receptor 101 [Branchiostoma floridae]
MDAFQNGSMFDQDFYNSTNFSTMDPAVVAAAATVPLDVGPQISRITTGLHAASLGLVLACAPIASAIVLVILFRKPQLLTISNRFVCNLLVVDLFQSLLVVPFALVSTIAQDWVFADAFCKVTAILLHLFLHVAVITVVIISVDRYLAILHPLSYNDRMTPNTSMYLIGFAWVLGAVQSTPPLYKVGSFGFDPDQLTCTVLWTNTYSFPYAIYNSLAAFWCPLVIMGLGYWQVFLAARKQHKLIYPSVKRRTLHKGIVEAAVSCAVLPGPAHNPSLAAARSRSLDDLRRPRRTFRMASRRIKRMQKDCKAAKIVFIVMATHLLSIGPHTALVLVKASIPETPVPAYAGALVICLYFLQTCLHPCVYAYVHRSIRREVALLLCRTHSAQVVPWDDQMNVNGQTSNNAGGHVRRCLSLTENMTYTAPATLPGDTFVRHSGPLPTLTETTTDVDLGHAVRKVIVVSSTASL